MDDSLDSQAVILARDALHLPYGEGAIISPPEGLPFDFADANIGVLPFGISGDEVAWCDKMEAVYLANPCKAQYNRSLTEVVQDILRTERHPRFQKYLLSVSALGAREALTRVLTSLVSPERPCIAYPSPTYTVFDLIAAEIPGSIPGSEFVTNADDFVAGVESFPYKQEWAALLIVDPSNPLGYSLGKKHIARLEELAEKDGFMIVFDDVFRGLRGRDNLCSASDYSQRSIIVETTSKRFGLRGHGITWTLIPSEIDLKLPEISIPCEGCAATSALALDALYSTAHDERIRLYLESNTQAFLNGFGGVTNLGAFHVPFEGSPFFTYFMPGPWKGRSFSLVQEIAPVLQITSGIKWMAQRDLKMVNALRGDSEAQREIQFANSYLRICPTKENPERSYLAGKGLALFLTDSL